MTLYGRIMYHRAMALKRTSRRGSRGSRSKRRPSGNAPEPITPVIFRVWPKSEGGGVIALFPTHPGTNESYTCSSYEHVGQHGSADCHGLIRRTRLAKPQEYASLKRELEGAPYHYRFKVYARVTRAMDDERRATGRR